MKTVLLLFVQYNYNDICVSIKKYKAHGGVRLTNIDAGNYTYFIYAISLHGNGSKTEEKYFIIEENPGE